MDLGEGWEGGTWRVPRGWGWSSWGPWEGSQGHLRHILGSGGHPVCLWYPGRAGQDGELGSSRTPLHFYPPGSLGGGLELSVLRWPHATPPELCGFNQLSELLPHLDTDRMGELWSGTSGIITAADREHLCRGPPTAGGHPGGGTRLGEAQGLREGSCGGAGGDTGVPLTLGLPSAPESPLAASVEGEVPPGSPPPNTLPG
ncbi:uncharacterized protein LOC113940173 isoform X1 [Corapipo altera]|uniref:uncharacterized protein LOC113940173 isoform X1 n=1 Tax=Corapipo altera TaxID=415028 RepID=UPI000FD637C1|nr:uncharacterized protein LOC113940173 isoform X1 [Corapipo altera]